MQKMVECYLGKQLITVIPEEAVEGQRQYWERQGRGQDFIAKTAQQKQADEQQAAALRNILTKKIK